MDNSAKWNRHVTLSDQNERKSSQRPSGSDGQSGGRNTGQLEAGKFQSSLNRGFYSKSSSESRTASPTTHKDSYSHSTRKYESSALRCRRDSGELSIRKVEKPLLRSTSERNSSLPSPRKHLPSYSSRGANTPPYPQLSESRRSWQQPTLRQDIPPPPPPQQPRQPSNTAESKAKIDKYGEKPWLKPGFSWTRRTPSPKHELDAKKQQ